MKEICECFKHMVKNGLVEFYKSNGKLFMPYIPNSKYRYNNCPCCLSEVREIETTRKEIQQMLTTP